MDLLLRGARVVDGTGAESRRADVGISGDRISALGDLNPRDAGERIDLDGLVLAPGFIDPHTHYDAQVLWDPDLTPSSWHGVTSVVMGNCGFGVALDPDVAPIVEFLGRHPDPRQLAQPAPQIVSGLDQATPELAGQLFELVPVDPRRVQVLEARGPALLPVLDQIRQQDRGPAHSAFQNREVESGETPWHPAHEKRLDQPVHRVGKRTDVVVGIVADRSEAVR